MALRHACAKKKVKDRGGKPHITGDGQKTEGLSKASYF